MEILIVPNNKDRDSISKAKVKFLTAPKNFLFLNEATKAYKKIMQRIIRISAAIINGSFII